MARYEPSYKGVGDMLRSLDMKAAMLTRAEKIKARAIEIAPKDSTQYVRSFSTHAVRRGSRRKDRAVAFVTNDAPYAFYLEYGTEDTPKFRVLGKAMTAK